MAKIMLAMAAPTLKGPMRIPKWKFKQAVSTSFKLAKRVTSSGHADACPEKAGSCGIGSFSQATQKIGRFGESGALLRLAV